MNDDLISRQAAIKANLKVPDGNWSQKRYAQEIRKQPSVDVVQVKRGKWIRDEFGSRCERCGLYAYRYENGRPWESDYCPYCGADMREVDDE